MSTEDHTTPPDDGVGQDPLQTIARIEHDARAAVAGAGDSQALEQARIAYLGRKAELPQLLRGVAQLQPAQRGAVGKAANQARQALEQLIESRAGELSGRSSNRGWRRIGST